MPESAPPIPTALAELQAWPHWVVWRVEEREGKPTKVPYQPQRPRRKARSTEPETWGTYQQASDACLDDATLAGVGYVFAPDDEYCGVDLDKCVEPAESGFAKALGPTVREPARRFVTAFDSYTELSPSGTGLHIIVRGRVNGDRNRTKKTPWGGEFEFYDHARFFTITGEHLIGTPTVIVARQAELDKIAAELFPASPVANGNGKAGVLLVPATAALDDKALEEKIRASKQGDKFAELFDRGAGEGGASEADLGLCNILAFWVGPSETEIDRWFRRSALMRDKWDEKRGDTTYGGYTIARALEGRTAYWSHGPKASKAAPRRPKDDDTELSYADELAAFFGLIDDSFVSGWRSSRRATCRVVLSTRNGLVFDVENWKATTTSARALSQEVRLQMGSDPVIEKADMGRLDVLVGQFCQVFQTMTVQDRAVELGVSFLQEAGETIEVDLGDQAERYRALLKIKETHPQVRARADGTATVAACIVLKDKVGRRYVRISWFVDYVKANAVSSQAGAIVEAIETPGNWSRLNNTQSRMTASDPATKNRVWQVLYEVPVGWPEVTS